MDGSFIFYIDCTPDFSYVINLEMLGLNNVSRLDINVNKAVLKYLLNLDNKCSFVNIPDAINICDCLIGEPYNIYGKYLGLIVRGSTVKSTQVNYKFYNQKIVNGLVCIFFMYDEDLKNCIGFNIKKYDVFDGIQGTVVKIEALNRFGFIFYDYILKILTNFRIIGYMNEKTDLRILTLEDIKDKQLKNQDVYSRLLIDKKSKNFLIREAEKDGRFKIFNVDGNSRYDCIIYRIDRCDLEKDKGIGLQLKSTGKTGRYDKHIYGNTHEYYGMILICMAFNENYETCVSLDWFYGSDVTQRILALVPNSNTFEQFFDIINIEFSLFDLFNNHNRLKLVTMEEAEIALSVHDLEEYINFKFFKSIFPQLDFERTDFEFRIYDFIINIKHPITGEIIGIKIQQKPLLTTKVNFGYTSYVIKTSNGQQIRYSLEDDIDCFLFLSKKNAPTCFYLITTVEMYYNNRVTLRNDPTVNSCNINFYPPFVSKKCYRNEWANCGYFNINDPNLYSKVMEKMIQSYNNRSNIKKALQPKTEIYEGSRLTPEIRELLTKNIKT